jgi:exopolysaccharide biosynthesis predicted pyruvyltransferase EpsI
MLVNAEFRSNSVFIPEFIIPLEQDSISADLVEKLKHIMLTEEQNIIDAYKPFDSKAENNANLEDWVTNRAFEYNLLNFGDKYPEINELKQFICNQYKNYVGQLGLKEEVVYIQVWINVLRKGSRFFTKHHHAHVARLGNQTYAYVSGNICIDAVDTHTYYQHPVLDMVEVSIKNIPGESILFPSWVIHRTDQNLSENPRLSIAFDIITEELWKQRGMDNPENYIRLN